MPRSTGLYHEGHERNEEHEMLFVTFALFVTFVVQVGYFARAARIWARTSGFDMSRSRCGSLVPP
jgi:hypothetical protein